MTEATEVLSRLCKWVGARMSNSMWKSSHQKGAEESIVWE